MGILSFLFGSKDNKNNPQPVSKTYNAALEDITSRIDEEEGWSDIFLKMVSEVDTGASHIYVAKGLYKGRVVGIEIEVSSSIGAGVGEHGLDPAGGMAADAVQLRSLGAETDHLIEALAALYGFPGYTKFTKQPVVATVFSLNSMPVDLSRENYYKLKVFLHIEGGVAGNEHADEDVEEDNYAEVFLNINTRAKEIELHEKDEGYRKALLRAFTM